MNDIVNQAKGNQAEIDLIAETYNESTGLSWLWAFLFGPLYFWVHGFVARGFVVLLLNFIIIGFLVSPFLAYPAWRKRAESRAIKMHAVTKAAQNR